MDTAALIRSAREESGLSQRMLAERAGITQSTLSRFENGRRLPSIPTLRTILAAAGKQVRAELEPLDADIRRAIDELREEPIDDRSAVLDWSLIDDLAGVDHRVEGLAAASLLGAPVPVDALTLGLADAPETYTWLAATLDSWAFRFRAPDWESSRVLLSLDAVGVRAIIDEHCPDRTFTLIVGPTVGIVTLRPPDVVSKHIRLATARGTIPVQPLHEIGHEDPYVARVLAVLRGEPPGRDAAAPGTAGLRQRQESRATGS